MSDPITTSAAPELLVEGQRLDQPTFHALYQAMPPATRAQLIDGVVHMPCPVGDAHSRAHVHVIVWLGYYAENTPAVEVLDNATRRASRWRIIAPSSPTIPPSAEP